MKRYKKELNGKLEIGQVFYTKRFSLTVDRALCKGCKLCEMICPRDAIKLVPQPSVKGKAVAPIIDVDVGKCDYHGICAVICPFSAIKIHSGDVGGDMVEGAISVVKGVFPVLTRDLEIDESKCKKGCKECAEKCPLNVIEMKEKAVVGNRELCAGCQICWEVCPEDAVKLTKFIEGVIRIDEKLCPKACKNCLDVCPVDALYIDENKKVRVNDTNCIYCGACETVCPVPEAINIKRTVVRHTPIESGAWYKGLERVTSFEGLNKEMGAIRAVKQRKAVGDLKEKK